MTDVATRPTFLSFSALAPQPPTRSLDWFRANIQTHEGRPYDHGAFPHLGAPGGPCDALDDPAVWTIWLQFASRCAKTFFGQSAQLFYAAYSPCPMMFASSDEKTATDVVSRTYRMIERCGPLRKQLRPVHRRRQSQVDLDYCRIYVAWARSVSTLADKAVRFGHANEIDKWEHESTSKEADPLKLFDDRQKEYQSRKALKESTPTVKGRSRIERGRLASTNCKYNVPCPHCRGYQPLVMDRIKWQKTENGKSDKDLARRTAYYECAHCSGKILDHHRVPMMRLGVWVPEGCGVDPEKARAAAERWSIEGAGSDGAALWRGWPHADWITGSLVRDGRDAGYHLSSLYALTLGWGDIAAEFVACKDKPQDLRNFINQWLAETWEIAHRKQTWEKLGERLISNVPQGVVPPGFALLTCGIDKQIDHYVYVVDAWAPGHSSHTLTYGLTDSLEEIYEDILSKGFQHADGGPTLRIRFTLVDSGFQPAGVVAFCNFCCKKGTVVWPCKGSSVALNVAYSETKCGKDTATPGAPLIRVDTITTQDWLDKQLHTLTQENDGAASLFQGSLGEHQDFLEQLLNDAAVHDLDTHGYEREAWNRIDTSVPNDYRDCRRYAYAAMLRTMRGKPIRARVPVPAVARRDDSEKKPAPSVQFIERAGGWMQGLGR